ncbi:hypothetical protein BH20ACT8_BH20ACT8_04440 [soil metagenome]
MNLARPALVGGPPGPCRGVGRAVTALYADLTQESTTFDADVTG